MQIYLVGGAVRDQYLGLPIKERDWVVVGSTPEAMIAQGFRPVGKSFPVFLHPKTQEEYALARTERKVAKGYKGFTFYYSPDVTLEEDLKRRDLTINAMAQSDDGQLIDPHGGLDDLRHKLFRHVSDAFQEDPVRILRLARFAAQFSDFSVHSETITLMQAMVKAGEVDALVPERVFQELKKALNAASPVRFFEVLQEAHAIEPLFPEIQLNGAGVKKLVEYVPTITGPILRWAILLHDLSIDQVQALCARYRVPLDYADLAKMVVEFRNVYWQMDQQPERVLFLLEKTDAMRRPERFYDFLKVCEACLGVAQSLPWLSLIDVIKSVDVTGLVKQGLKGTVLVDEIRKLRLQEIRRVLDGGLF